MRRIASFFALAMILGGTARAAEADLYCLTGTSSTGAPIFLPASATNPCPMTFTFSPSGTQDVNLIQVGGVTVLRGAGAVGTGSARIAVGQDITTIAGSAPGVAGTASANVLTIQGIASMTAVKVDGTGGTFPVSGTVAATQSGTWTVQPGNTANTTPWLATINQGGNAATVSAGGALKVDGSAATQPVSGTVAVTQSTSPWIVAGGGTAGSAATGVVTIQGIASMTKLLVTPDANSAVNVAQYGGTNVVNGGVAGSASVGGTVATNVAITANPLNLGAQAVSSENAAVTTARQVQLVADLVGKLIVSPYANSDNFVSGVITSAMTGTTSTSLVAAPASGLRNYLTNCVFSNSHATVGTDMILQDGNGGTTLYVVPAAPAFGGASVSFPTPLRQPTTATAIYVANVTTGANTKASCSGYIGR